MAFLNISSICKKSFLINDLISSQDLDFFLMTETWLSDYNRDSLTKASELSEDWGSGQGALQLFLRIVLKCRLLSVEKYVSFKVQVFKVDFTSPVIFVLIYRPPKYKFLSSMIPCCDPLVILGDFTIHICSPEKPLVQFFLLLMDSFTQSVVGAVRKLGHTLDLVLSWGVPVGELTIENLGLSDHFVVMFNITFSRPTSRPVSTGRHAWRQLKSKMVSQSLLNENSRQLRQKWRQA